MSFSLDWNRCDLQNLLINNLWKCIKHFFFHLLPTLIIYSQVLNKLSGTIRIIVLLVLPTGCTYENKYFAKEENLWLYTWGRPFILQAILNILDKQTEIVNWLCKGCISFSFNICKPSIQNRASDYWVVSFTLKIWHRIFMFQNKNTTL